ncbi:C-terminal processing peptidase [Halobacteroides halobius DSM 5150]|uniref:C-terminal processing peptidase n=1 Tax=Halobacteroides halobius (strain ATCC 35273 / DSM 5150 / MD-1) TaxID=748449 RepID=L0KDB2_HALHC|nr:S41 family peptidase [Halobacteroides halobius]AGB42083.1 C-terminal processing peptidase [Halobacteroides halobius DSM 5150]
MFKRKRLLGLSLILVMLFAAGTVGFFFHKAQANADVSLSQSQTQQLNPIQKLFLVLDVVKRSYVEKPDNDKLLTGAINGMLKSLDDPYTVYLSAQEYKEMKQGFSGEYSGIGIVITMKNNQLTIISPIKGTPGDKSGLQAGDLIMTVNGKATKEMTMTEAVKLMKGPAGTKVQLGIKRKLENDKDKKQPKFKEFKVDITRAEVEVPFVTSKLKKDHIGYIRISQFIQGAGQKVATRIDKLHKQGAKAFILDLRNNPGGLLQEAANVSSNFLNQGPVVTIKGRNGQKQTIGLSDQINNIDAPLVVLVNGGSASASEIVTGAVQDYNRGVVIGEQTFGKGVVQSVVPLPDGSAIKLTTARYYTPDGRYIHHKGIKPDITIEQNLKTKVDEQLQRAIKVLQQKLK